MSDDEIAAARQRDREWAATDLGKLFYAYENATARAWQLDTQLGAADFPSFATEKRAREAWDTQQKTREAFLAALREPA